MFRKMSLPIKYFSKSVIEGFHIYYTIDFRFSLLSDSFIGNNYVYKFTENIYNICNCVHGLRHFQCIHDKTIKISPIKTLLKSKQIDRKNHRVSKANCLNISTLASFNNTHLQFFILRNNSFKPNLRGIINVSGVQLDTNEKDVILLNFKI